MRQDKVDETGKVSLRYISRLYKIGIGRAHKGRPVKLLIADQSIRVIDLDGQLIRELTLDPSRTTSRSRTPSVSTMSRDIRLRCLETRQNGGGGIRTLVRGLDP